MTYTADIQRSRVFFGGTYCVAATDDTITSLQHDGVNRATLEERWIQRTAERHTITTQGGSHHV